MAAPRAFVIVCCVAALAVLVGGDYSLSYDAYMEAPAAPTPADCPALADDSFATLAATTTGICWYGCGIFKYPLQGAYGSNDRCGWRLQNPNGLPITFYVENYAIESNFDELVIYETTGAVLATVTGSGTATQSITSTGSTILLKFTSDGQNQRHGFVLRWMTDPSSFMCCPTAQGSHAYVDYPACGGSLSGLTNSPGSASRACRIACKPGFADFTGASPINASAATCEGGKGGQAFVWDHGGSLTCTPVTCKRPTFRADQNVTLGTCSDSGAVGSICAITCPTGYTGAGLSATCTDDMSAATGASYQYPGQDLSTFGCSPAVASTSTTTTQASTTSSTTSSSTTTSSTTSGSTDTSLTTTASTTMESTTSTTTAATGTATGDGPGAAQDHLRGAKDDTSSSDTGAIVGGVVGGVAGLLLILVLIYAIAGLRRRRAAHVESGGAANKKQIKTASGELTGSAAASSLGSQSVSASGSASGGASAAVSEGASVSGSASS